MEDLKDSSAIKQDADIVAILYRERNTNRQLKDDFILNTDKNRHGQSGNKRFDIDKFCRVTESLNPVDGKDNTKAIDDDIKESEKETESNMKGINI